MFDLVQALLAAEPLCIAEFLGLLATSPCSTELGTVDKTRGQYFWDSPSFSPFLMSPL